MLSYWPRGCKQAYPLGFKRACVLPWTKATIVAPSVGIADASLAPVLWVIATLWTITVIHRVGYTWWELRAFM